MGYIDGNAPFGGSDGKPDEIDHAFVGGFDKVEGVWRPDDARPPAHRDCPPGTRPDEHD